MKTILNSCATVVVGLMFGIVFYLPLHALQISQAWAQEPVIVFENMTQCSTFQWDEWTGEALREFRIKVKRDDVDLPYVAIPPEATTVVCTDVSVAPEAKFEVFITAVDLAGNESDPTCETPQCTLLRFIYVIPDVTSPPPPGNFCMIGETQDGSIVVRCQ